MNDRKNMVAPCGLDCGICELYLSGKDEKLKQYLISSGIQGEALPCAGCRNIDGQCPVIQGQCATFECAREKNVSFCSECRDFPCSKLAPAADRADILPHNTKVYNLCVVKKDGLDSFINKSLDIKLNYYKGKMKIGNGPELEKKQENS